MRVNIRNLARYQLIYVGKKARTERFLLFSFFSLPKLGYDNSISVLDFEGTAVGGKRKYSCKGVGTVKEGGTGHQSLSNGSLELDLCIGSHNY